MRSGDEIGAVIVSQPATEREWRMRARMFIDCSGDGTVAADAGASFMWGREGRESFGESRAHEVGDDCVLCPTLMFSARDVGHPVPFTPPPWARRYPHDDALPFRPHPFVGSGYWWIEYGGTLDPIRDAELIRDELVAIVLGVWDHLKNHGDHGAETYELDWIGSVLGKRESRRFIGDHVLTQSDVEGKRLFHDRVAFGGWGLDHLHPPEGIDSTDPAGNLPQRLHLQATYDRWFPYGVIVKSLYEDPPAHWPDIMPPTEGVFSIPFGCLYSRDVRNLLLAGRHVSATHIAFGSTRVQATTAVMGQAAGAAAALCVRRSTDPRTLRQHRISELQQQLLKSDCYIIGLRNQDPGDVLRTATARASSQAVLEMTEVEAWLPLDCARGQMACFSEPRVDAVSLLLRSTGDGPREVRAALLQAARLDDFSSEEIVATATAQMSAGIESWVDLRFEVDIDPVLPHWVRVEPVDGVEWGCTAAEEIGLQRAEWFDILGRWQPVRGSHAVRATPAARPFMPGNVVNGVSRPEVGPNLWISASGGYPQWIELTLREPSPIDTVYVTFDTNLSDLVDSGAAPECARDYRLAIGVGQTYETVAEVEGNYQRRRKHTFAAREASRVRLSIDATNGAAQARVYEVRAYKEGE
jgi:hypothetical protein